jgi:hypothetical protein
MNDQAKFFWENRPTSATQALHDVMAERHRQVMVEGWTAKHDDEHDTGEMARAAACYALHAGSCFAWPQESYQHADPHHGDPAVQDTLWPWDMDWWKPKNPRRDLVRAAALLLAEIERLDRAAGAQEVPRVFQQEECPDCEGQGTEGEEIPSGDPMQPPDIQGCPTCGRVKRAVPRSPSEDAQTVANVADVLRRAGESPEAAELAREGVAAMRAGGELLVEMPSQSLYDFALPGDFWDPEAPTEEESWAEYDSWFPIAPIPWTEAYRVSVPGGLDVYDGRNNVVGHIKGRDDDGASGDGGMRAALVRLSRALGHPNPVDAAEGQCVEAALIELATQRIAGATPVPPSQSDPLALRLADLVNTSQDLKGDLWKLIYELRGAAGVTVRPTLAELDAVAEEIADAAYSADYNAAPAIKELVRRALGVAAPGLQHVNLLCRKHEGVGIKVDLSQPHPFVDCPHCAADGVGVEGHKP